MPPNRPMQSNSIYLPDDNATAKLGAAIAMHLSPGDLVLLAGDLGVGKTTLARATIRALVGDTALEVPSPSFALVQPYDCNGKTIIHADLYRLADAQEIEELGILEDLDAIVLVEWPERAPQLSSLATLTLSLSMAAENEGRDCAISAKNAQTCDAIIKAMA